jgi:bifunctional non-homologous end joining protein LigD
MRRANKHRGNPVNAATLARARRGALPETIELQLPTRAPHVPLGCQWLHESKLEGFRLLARVAPQGVRLFDGERRWRVPPLERALLRLPVESALLDGQIVALEADGTSSVAQLRRAVAAGKLGRLVYHAFDLLHVDGFSLFDVELVERKRALQMLIASAPHRGPLRYVPHIEGHGDELYADICRLGLAGIVSKLRSARYRSGPSTEWLDVEPRAELATPAVRWTIDRPRLASLGRLRARSSTTTARDASPRER